jgi:hypothetical protein
MALDRGAPAVPNRATLVSAACPFGGGDAPSERPSRRQMHDAGDVESRARAEDRVEWKGEGREGVLTPAVPGSLAWAASSSGAATSTAMESGAVSGKRAQCTALVPHVN